MAFDNVKGILNIGSPISSYKLLLMQGMLSRPKYSSLFRALLQPFVRDGRIAVKYRCHNRMLKSFVRMSELESDFYSTRELGVNDVYSLDFAFHPDLVIDGGGNIGMFTLRATAGLAAAGDTAVRYTVCEPVPQNLEQIGTHLALNGVQAGIMPVCLGGTPRTIPFYCREANQSSFDSTKPYRSVMEIPVVTLQDAIGPAAAERILIKLDIEGMEVEALSAFLPVEHRAVYLVGELHGVAQNAPLMEELFRRHGWTLELRGIADDLCSFRGCSPAALPLLPSLANAAQPAAPARMVS
jgi:FkbM family methyltransferase